MVSSDSNDVNVDYEESAKLLAGWMAAHNNPRVIIATGFIARDKNGRPTTLKRCVSRGLYSIRITVRTVHTAYGLNVSDLQCASSGCPVVLIW